MPESTYHQIHFAWADPTLLGRFGPGPAASSLPESEQPVLRSWRDRLVPALTADYRSALPDRDPADYPETLWARAYPDGQAALVYRWPGDVRSAHAWAIVGPAHGLTLPRLLSLHENPNTRPAHRRPPAPGWATMDTLTIPGPWERTATPGAVRTRDRRAAETTVEDEPILVGAVAAALHRPDQPIHITLAPERADLWQAVQLRFLWGLHRSLHDVLTPPRAIPAAGWSWSFSTYDPVLGTTDGQHLAFGPPVADTSGPFLEPPAPDYRRVAEGLVTVLREEGGDALARHLRERGVPEAPTFADRRALLCDWLAPRPPERSHDDVPVPENLPDTEVPGTEVPGTEAPDTETTDAQTTSAQTPHADVPDTGTPLPALPDLPEAEAPGEEETGPRPPSEPRFSPKPPRRERPHREEPALPGDPVPGVPGGRRSLRGVLDENAAAHTDSARGREQEEGVRARRRTGDTDTPPDEDNESLWPETVPESLPEEPESENAGETPEQRPRPRNPRPRIAPARGPSDDGAIRNPRSGEEPFRPDEPDEPGKSDESGESDDSPTVLGRIPARTPGRILGESGESRFRFLGRGTRAVPEPNGDEPPSTSPATSGERAVGTSPEAPATPSTRIDEVPEPVREPVREPARGTTPGPTPGPARGPDLTDGPQDREPADAPPLSLLPDTATNTPRESPLDYAAETEPGPDDPFREEDAEDNWPTQYVDLPLSRLERWHLRHGPEGARTDVVDARAAVRAERAELQRVRDERDHYHAEVQELRREVARLDRPWLEGPDEDDEVPETVRPRRWPSRVLVVVLLVAFLATGLEAGARFGLGALDLLGLLATRFAEIIGVS